MNSSEPKKKFVPKHTRVAATEKNGFGWLSLTTIISASVPILYVIGRTYSGIYLETYGVNSDLFPRSTQDYLFCALSAIAEVVYRCLVSFDLLMPLIMAGGASIYLGFVLWFEQSKFRPWLKEKVRYLIYSRPARVVGVISFGPIYVSVLTATIIFVMFFLAMPLVVGLTAGRYVAHHEMEQDKGGCVHPSADRLSACTVISKGGADLYTGRIIAASDAVVAIAVDGQAIVLERKGLELRIKK